VARLLPDYMVPATVTPLPALPLTTNGKLDTGRLPAPDLAAPAESAGEESAGPAVAGDFARDLLAAWTNVLGRQAGPDDDFFELGGNSLVAVQLVGEISRAFKADVPVAQLFDLRTVRGLAGAIEETLIERVASLTDQEAMAELSAIDEAG
jgi:acyl carrier protein